MPLLSAVLFCNNFLSFQCSLVQQRESPLCTLESRAVQMLLFLERRRKSPLLPCAFASHGFPGFFSLVLVRFLVPDAFTLVSFWLCFSHTPNFNVGIRLRLSVSVSCRRPEFLFFQGGRSVGRKLAWHTQGLGFDSQHRVDMVMNATMDYGGGAGRSEV